MSAEKKLAVTLYYLKDTGSLWMTANTFGLHQCTVSKTINEVCDVLNNEVGPEYLVLPKNEEDMRKVVSGFELKFGLLQAFGCIDGTHVEIKRPIENAQDFFNKIRLQFRQYVTVAEDSWMLNANGLVRFMTLRCSPIQKSTKISKQGIFQTLR